MQFAAAQCRGCHHVAATGASQFELDGVPCGRVGLRHRIVTIVGIIGNQRAGSNNVGDKGRQDSKQKHNEE